VLPEYLLFGEPRARSIRDRAPQYHARDPEDQAAVDCFDALPDHVRHTVRTMILSLEKPSR
jgi:hypothetical protein